MTLDVDATDAPMKILHATLSMPARPGAMTLFYPKWIPGEHMPSGPIANLTGLHIFADGSELDWRRDLVEMNAFAVTVPAGAKTLTAKYDYVVPYSRRRVRHAAVDQREDRGHQLVHRRPVSDGREPGRDHRHGDIEGARRLEARRLARRRSGRRQHDPLRADVARDAERSPGAARRALPQHHAVAGRFARRRARHRRRRRQRLGAAVPAVAHRHLQEDRPRGAARSSAASATIASTTGC